MRLLISGVAKPAVAAASKTVFLCNPGPLKIHPSGRNCHPHLSTQTDANGEFVLLGLADTSGQTVELVAQAAGLAPQIQIVRLLQPTNTAEFVLAPGNVFRGRVVDDAGQPIAQAAVRTDFDFEKQIPDRFEWLTNTDAQGRFEWNSAPAERVCFWFEAGGYEVIRSHSFLADGTDHEIRLKRNADRPQKLMNALPYRGRLHLRRILQGD